jgi:hypothetical protein
MKLTCCLRLVTPITVMPTDLLQFILLIKEDRERVAYVTHRRDEKCINISVFKPDEVDLVSVLIRKLEYSIKIALKKKCHEVHRMDFMF